MVNITKKEALELNSIGVKFGTNGISKTYSSNPHYYLCESNYNLQQLNKIRKAKVVKRWEQQ